MTENRKSKTIFRSLFVPMISIMIVQALIFYFVAVYGGIENILSQNAADILSTTMISRKSEIETQFNSRWTELDDCIAELNERYSAYESERGSQPFTTNTENSIDFLEESGDVLIDTLRHCHVNGIFLILNDIPQGQPLQPEGEEQKYGLCIRDMDQDNSYSGRDDLLLERSPSSIVNTLGCLLDSWWEAKYSFTGYDDGAFYYAPLLASAEHPNSSSDELAYFDKAHSISESGPKMVSYSMPLLSKDGHPYAVLGVEMSVNYISSLLPSKELNQNDNGCYILALNEKGTDDYIPLSGSGALYNRCFSDDSLIKRGADERTGGFSLIAKNNARLYATEGVFRVYNNNSPFESQRLVLLAVAETSSLFSYINNIKMMLFTVSLLSLTLGVIASIMASRRFAAPITALASRAMRADKSTSDYKLEHIGIIEIDRLVDSIEELNQNISRNSTRTEFFSRMSHDMRTPMNAIISFSSRELLESADEAAKDDYLAKIHDSGIYLLGLINDVLDMTKIESSKTELHMTRVCAAKLFNTSVSMIEKLAQKKHLSFKANIGIPQEYMIMADEQQLCQIVMNLLSNAVKFTPNGGSVDFSTLITDEHDLVITVSDNGIGMSDNFLKSLYTPFAQENNNHEGTGLGLSITKKLVELMNGTIECQSKKGEGTTFTVTMPVVVTSSDASATVSDGEPGNDIDVSVCRGKRVLVCEDNIININIITLLLERIGITVDIAENGKQGVELFTASEPGTYDAVLMDIRMPIMDGLEAARTIRHLDRKDGLSVPIIAMTADAFAEDEQISRLAGMNDHLSKPIDIDKLYTTLVKYFSIPK